MADWDAPRAKSYRKYRTDDDLPSMLQMLVESMNLHNKPKLPTLKQLQNKANRLKKSAEINAFPCIKKRIEAVEKRDGITAEDKDLPIFLGWCESVIFKYKTLICKDAIPLLEKSDPNDDFTLCLGASCSRFSKNAITRPKSSLL